MMPITNAICRYAAIEYVHSQQKNMAYQSFDCLKLIDSFQGYPMPCKLVFEQHPLYYHSIIQLDSVTYFYLPYLEYSTHYLSNWHFFPFQLFHTSYFLVYTCFL